MEEVFCIKSNSVMYEVIDSEAVVLNLEAGTYYSFNIVATQIWELIAANANDVTQVLTFAGSHNKPFIDFLLSQDLISQERNSSDFSHHEPAVLSLEQVAQWQAFTDLQDLLLLDPVHDIALRELG